MVGLLAILEKINIETHQLVFSGGTALTKSSIKILRMSEDVDIKLIPSSAFSQMSRNARKQGRKKTVDLIEQAIISSDDFQIIQKTARDESRYIELEVQYPQLFNIAPCLRPIIKLELMETILLHDAEPRNISSLVNEAYEMPSEVNHFHCVSVATTLVEKVVSMLRRTAASIRYHARHDDETLVRHIYDVHFICLGEAFDGSELGQMFKAVVQEDIARYGSQHPEFKNDAKSELLFGLTHLETQTEYRERFEIFVSPMVYNTALHDFDTCFASFKAVAGELIGYIED